MNEQTDNCSKMNNDTYKCGLKGKHLMEAGAGTGKTYNIVTLFLRMVLGGIPVKKILVVTFTEAATAELVNRIRKGLNQMNNALQESGGEVSGQCKPFLDEKQWKDIFAEENYPQGYGWNPSTQTAEQWHHQMRRFIQQAVQDFDQAAISTIHGFCRTVLNENVFESGVRFGLTLRPQFNDVLYASAADFCRRCLYSSFIFPILHWLGMDLTPDYIVKQTQKILNVSKEDVDWNLGKDNTISFDSLKTFCQNHPLLLDDDILDSQLLSDDKLSECFRTWEEFYKQWGGATLNPEFTIEILSKKPRFLREMKEFLSSNDFEYETFKKLCKSFKKTSRPPQYIEDFLNKDTRAQIKRQNYKKLLDYLANIKKIQDSIGKQNMKKNSDELDSFRKYEASSLMKRARELKEQCPTDEEDKLLKTFDEKLKTIKKNLKTLVEHDAVEFIRDKVAIYKREHGEISFNDLLIKVRDILKNEKDKSEAERPLTETIRKRYDAVLVDEFQDTDDVQYSIFEWLFAGNWREPGETVSSPEPSQLDKIFFMIGDPKQAIYSFRGGDLKTYQVAASGVDDTAKLTLTANFRSSKVYIDRMNALFEYVMNNCFYETPPEWRAIEFPDNTQEDNNQEDKTHRLYQISQDGAEEEVTDNLLTCRNNFKEKTDNKEEKGNTDKKEEALKHLVEDIDNVLKAGFFHYVKVDNEIKRVDLNAGDIAVLVNSNYDGGAVCEALSKKGIPNQWYGDTSIFATPEAVVVLQLMESLLDLGTHGNVLELLSSPLFDCDVKKLNDIRTQSLSQVLSSLGSISQLWSKKSFMTAFDQLLHSSLEDLEKGTLGTGGTHSIAVQILEKQDGERVLAHYLQLAENLNAVAVERHLGQQGLTQFLKRRIDKDEKNDSHYGNQQERETVEDDDNGTDERFKIRLSSQNPAVQVMTAHKSKGLQFPIVFAFNILRKEIKTSDGGFYHEGRKRRYCFSENETLKNEQADEALRLFYVVVTRAQYLCRFVDPAKGGKQKAPILYELLEGRPPLQEGEQGKRQDTEKAQGTEDGGNQPQEREANASPLAPLLPQKDSLVFSSCGSSASKPEDFETELESFSSDHLSRGWSTISFTTLSPSHREYKSPDSTDDAQEGPLNDEEGREPSASEESTAQNEPEDTQKIAPIFQLPQGKPAGNCWHSMFEHLDFQWGENPEEIRQDGQTLQQWIAARLVSQFRGDPKEKEGQLSACLDAVLGILCNRLPLGFSMKEIAPEKRMTELRFVFHLKNGFRAGIIPEQSGTDIREWLDFDKDFWQKELDFPMEWKRDYHADKGHNLTGSIDLLFEHNGKTYILDWKANSLKNDFQNFLPDNLPHAMLNSYYPFQYMLYTVAWMRFYDSLNPGHQWTRDEYQERFGGCIYVFCRGVSQSAQGTDTKWPRGFHYVSPTNPNGLLRWEIIGKLYEFLDVSSELQAEQD